MKRARRQLAAHQPARFSAVFWYGAVDIARTHLVVWVLLAGEPDELPAWYFPHRDQVDDRYDAALLAEIDDMRGIVIASFAREGWADPEGINVGFDAAARVAAEGGWSYFR